MTDDLSQSLALDVGLIALGIVLLLASKSGEKRPEKDITPNQRYSAQYSKGGGRMLFWGGLVLLLKDLIKLVM